MLEQYYVRPVTVDRVRTSWIVPAIEQYVGWLAERRYSSRTVFRRIPLLVAYGEFAKRHGATELAHLAAWSRPCNYGCLSTRAVGVRRERARRSASTRATLSAKCCAWLFRVTSASVDPAGPTIRLKRKRRGSFPISPKRRGFARVRCISTDSTCVNSPLTSRGSDSRISPLFPSPCRLADPAQCLWHMAGLSSLPPPRGGNGQGPKLPR